MTRTLVLWCPDWPLTAAGVPPREPAVVLYSERVVACSAAARQLGIRIGLRRREAQARCPHLTVLEDDPGHQSRMFHPAVTAAADLVPTIEVVRPGLLALGVRGPARVFGGEAHLAERLRAAVDQALTAPGCRIGIADGRFPAMLAARHASGDTPVYTVAPGQNAAFLAPQPLGALSVGLVSMGGGGRSRDLDPDALNELVELGHRLGVRTLADFAALPRTAVGDRFGRTGVHVHQLARGEDARPLVPRQVREEQEVWIELDPPAAQIEAAAFAARGPAAGLVAALTQEGRTCTVATIEAETAHGEILSRRWRVDDGFTAQGLVDRLRWQLDGWLSANAGRAGPTSGILVLRIIPEEVVEGAEQGSLLDEAAAVEPKVIRALTRIQGMLGPDAVLVAATADGRDPASWATTRVWGEPPPAPPVRPWPGRLPPPSPATVLPRPSPAEVVDDQGTTIGVSGRGVVTGAPARVRLEGRPWREVTGWAGPWPADERWWDASGRRRARFQLVDEFGGTFLLAVEDSRWQLEAIYD